MLSEYYLQVDETPLKAWRKAHENDFTYLRKDIKIGTPENDVKAWEILYNDFIKQIGLTKEFSEYLSLIKAKIEAQLAFLESEKNGFRDRFLLNEIEYLTSEIEKFHQDGGKGLTIIETLVQLSKEQGYHLKETEVTVLEYFTILRSNGGK